MLSKYVFFLAAFCTSLISACASFSGPSEEKALEAEAHAKISQSLFDERQYPGALVKIDEALAIDSQNPTYLMAKALIFLKMERLNDAERWMRVACEKRQEFPECWNNLSVVMRSQGKFLEAIQWADKALAVPTYPTPEFAYVNKSEALLSLKKNFEAKSLLKKALSQWPQDCGLRIRLARVQVRDRAFEDAAELNQFTQKLCTDSPLPLLWDAYIFYKIGNFSKSRYSLERVLRFFPKTQSEEWARSALEKLEQKVPMTEPAVTLTHEGA